MHKRLILVATLALMVAAIARWHVAILRGHPGMASLCSYLFLLMMIAYDLCSTHKVHRATLWRGAFLIFVQQIRIPIGQTPAWHNFASWIQTVAR